MSGPAGMMTFIGSIIKPINFYPGCRESWVPSSAVSRCSVEKKKNWLGVISRKITVMWQEFLWCVKSQENKPFPHSTL